MVLSISLVKRCRFELLGKILIFIPEKHHMVKGIIMDSCRLSWIFLKQILLGPIEESNIWLSALKITYTLLSTASFRSIPFLSFIEPIFAWNVPFVALIFLKRSLVFPILLFSSISLHWSLRKAFLSLLTILWNFAFRCLYLSFPPLLFASFLFTAICKASSDGHFAFLHWFSMGMVLIPVSYTMSWTSVHSSSSTLCLSDLVP